MAHQIRKPIFTISRSRALVNWQTRKALLDDLNGLDKAIPDIAKIKPDDALELMWRYLALSESIFARSDDSSGKLLGVFERACQSLAEIALQSKPDPIQLTDHTNELSAEPRDLTGIVASVIGLLRERRHRGRRHVLEQVVDGMEPSNRAR